MEYRESGEYKIAPVSKEILSDFTTPISLIRVLKNVSDRVFLLESVEDREKWGRFTFLGYAPKTGISCKDNVLKIGNQIGRAHV